MQHPAIDLLPGKNSTVHMSTSHRDFLQSNAVCMRARSVCMRNIVQHAYTSLHGPLDPWDWVNSRLQLSVYVACCAILFSLATRFKIQSLSNVIFHGGLDTEISKTPLLFDSLCSRVLFQWEWVVHSLSDRKVFISHGF